MKAFHNKDGKPVLMRMVSGIKENKDYLGEIDGLIGDGDHGMNMNKGFSLFQQRFEKGCEGDYRRWCGNYYS